MKTGRKLVRPEGIEPPTFRVEAECSIQLSYGRIHAPVDALIPIVRSSSAVIDFHQPQMKNGLSEDNPLIFWSEYKDSNLGPPGPKPGALPGCATLREAR